MRQKLNFWLVGGDLRQAALARALAEDGHTVHTYALEQGVEAALTDGSLEKIREADCVVLPLPAVQGEMVNAPLSQRQLPLEEVLEPLSPGQLVCAGMVSPAFAALGEERGLQLVDYFAREELAVANAVPGALAV